MSAVHKFVVVGEKPKKTPPVGTTEQSWTFLHALAAERERLGLRPITLGLNTARVLTTLLADSGLSDAEIDKIPRHMAMTEAACGVLPRQLLASRNAGMILEGLVDSPWKDPAGTQPTTTVSFDRFCLSKFGTSPIPTYDPRYQQAQAAYREMLKTLET